MPPFWILTLVQVKTMPLVGCFICKSHLHFWMIHNFLLDFNFKFNFKYPKRGYPMIGFNNLQEFEFAKYYFVACLKLNVEMIDIV